MWKMIFVGLLGGMGLLLFGISIMSEGLQKIAGAKLRHILSSLTHNKFLAVIIGALVTILFQSSTATTVTLVGLTSASIITLRQALGVILGADIGTTVTAQLIALKVTEIALPIVGIGAIIIFFGKRDKYRKYGQVLMGFGLIFLGLKVMSDVMYPLRSDPFFPQAMAMLGKLPILAIGISAIFTFLICSSAAAIGIIMVMAMQHLIDLHSAIFLLLGANIGTSFTALISSLGSTREAQRVATAHFLFKISGVLIILPFIAPIENLLIKITSSPSYQVANMHTFFNIAIAIIFLPFISHFALLLEKILPDKKSEDDFKPRYLDIKLLKTPSIALGLATKEVIHMWDYIFEMTVNIARIFEKNDLLLLQKVNQKEDKVDVLYKECSDYLTSILREPLSRQEFNKCIGLINIVNDLEHIGDIIEKNVTYLAQCKIDGGCNFSEEGWDELSIMHKRVCDLMQMANTALVTNNKELARKVIKFQPETEKMERHLRVLHIHRLKIGTQESERTSSMHLDLINAFLQLSVHIRNIAMEIADEHLEQDSSWGKIDASYVTIPN